MAASGVLRLSQRGSFAIADLGLGAAAVIAYVIIFALLACRVFWSEILALQPTIDRLVVTEKYVDRHPFRSIGSSGPPVALAAAFTLVSAIRLVSQFDTAVPLLIIPLVFVAYLAPATALWGYLSILLGLDRVGAATLRLDPFPEDASLGCRPLGRLAGIAFSVLILGFLPVVLVTRVTIVGLVISGVLFVAALGGFFLSLYRLHRKMAKVRAQYIAHADELFARAYAPIKQAPTFETLRDQALALSAAESIHRRAESIQKWPFDDRTFAWVIGISTGAISIALSRVVLLPFGI